MGESRLAVRREHQTITGISLERGVNAFVHALGEYAPSVIRPQVGVTSLQREYYHGGQHSVFWAEFEGGKKAIAVSEDNHLQAVYLIYPGGGVLKIDAITGREHSFLHEVSDTRPNPALEADMRTTFDLGEPDTTYIYK